jgi:hypothetical protein
VYEQISRQATSICYHAVIDGVPVDSNQKPISRSDLGLECDAFSTGERWNISLA